MRTNTHARAAILAVAAFAISCAGGRVPPDAERSVAVGRVVAVSPVYDAFTVADQATGERVRLEVERPSQLFYGEAPVAFSALEPGSIVRASYASTGEGFTALRVEVLAHPGELDGVRDWSDERVPEGGGPGGSGERGGR